MVEELVMGLISPAIVVVCYCIGLIVKHGIKKLDNKFIPVIVAVSGVILACVTQRGISLDIIAQGIISGWASTGIHQTFKNLKGEEKQNG